MGWWKRFRSGTKPPALPAFDGPEIALGEALAVDVHSHIVPGVDDGSANMEQSLELIERLVGLGYSGAVLTPHIHSDIYPNSKHTLQPAFDALRARVAERWPQFSLALAAEYFLDEPPCSFLRGAFLFCFLCFCCSSTF